MHAVLHERSDLNGARRALINVNGSPVVVLGTWSDKAGDAVESICAQWPGWTEELPDDTTVVALGGDGFLLRACHAVAAGTARPMVYGINFGHVGFLTNGTMEIEQLACTLGERLARAVTVDLVPLVVEADTPDGTISGVAFNEVSLLRSGGQASHLRLAVSVGDGELNIPMLVGDGILVGMPAGSTGYARSAGGAVLPLGSDAIQLVALAPYLPAWRGAVLPASCQVLIDVCEPDSRPVLCCLDHREVRGVTQVRAHADASLAVPLGFDPTHALDARVLAAQFPTQP